MSKLTKDLIAAMTPEEIESEILIALRDINQIRAQIDMAKAEHKQGAGYANASWFARANTALHIRGREHQMLQLEFSKKRKAANEIKAKRDNEEFERRFMTNAKRVLPPETYQAIMVTTQAELGKR